MHNVPVQSLIDHIKTAVDVDPWAKEMAEDLLKEHETANFYKCPNCGRWVSAENVVRWFCTDGEQRW